MTRLTWPSDPALEEALGKRTVLTEHGWYTITGEVARPASQGEILAARGYPDEGARLGTQMFADLDRAVERMNRDFGYDPGRVVYLTPEEARGLGLDGQPSRLRQLWWAVQDAWLYVVGRD